MPANVIVDLAQTSETPRKIGLFTATGIVIANIIGTGVFTSLGFQLADIHSGFVLLMLWIVGGIVALCGALCYGELAAALPRSGGEYHFLSRIYHPALGFMAGIVSATVGFAAPIALAAMAFGKYFDGVCGAGSPLVLSFAIVWLVSLAHISNLKFGSAFQNIWTIVKLLLIAALMFAALLIPRQPITFLPQPGDHMSILSGAFAVALIYVMYSYSGWNASVYITSEIDRPEKNVPRSLLLGTLIVIVAYTALNAAFLMAAPQDELRGQLEVALIAGKHIFGENGGRIVGAIICLGLVATISSMAWLGPRVTMAMGEDHSRLQFLARKNRHGIPINAALVQFIIVNALLLTNSFERVVVYLGLSLLFCALLTVIGVMVLRKKDVDLARPYRVSLYPLPPLLFAAVTVWMMIYLLRTRPTESLCGILTMLAGLGLYFLVGKRSS
ncbi:MAG: basic amino acid/polyamine antiporter, family [Verrucomicrobiota bacterium]|jgi:APA family basic amino acid/polyamine antiporter